MAALTKRGNVKNEVVEQRQYLCHHFCTRRSTGFINDAAASTVFVWKLIRSSKELLPVQILVSGSSKKQIDFKQMHFSPFLTL